MRNDRHAALLGVVLLAALLVPRWAAAQGRSSPHQNLGAMECTDCHRTTNWRDVSFDHRRTAFQLLGQHQTVPCAGCHDVRNFQGAVRACGACHADPHRGDAGPDCERCHSETGWRQVGALEAHARTRLPDLGVHAALRCEDCHRQTGAQQFTGAVAQCIACHQRTYDATTNPQHRTLGFATRCETCHQLATWQFALFAEHDAIFGIYSGSHAGVWRDCSTCHTNPSDYRIYTCTTCHTQAPSDGAHQGIPGYTWESTACLGCHPNGRTGDLSFHSSLFPIFSGAHGGAWSACTECHVDPSNRQVYSCMTGSCHPQPATDPAHAGITGYQYVAAQCYSCHPDGTAGSFAQHDAVFPINSGTHVGRWTSCAQCHTDPSNRAVFSCTTSGCHVQAATTSSHTGIPGYQYVSAQCLSCHPDGTRGTFTQHDPIFPINSGTHAGRWTSCAQCHTDPSSRAVYSCTTSGCHVQAATTTSHTGIPGYQYVSAQCLSCHPDGRRGTFTQHDPIFPINSGTHAGRWTSCAQCHTDPSTRAVFSCTTVGCHAQATTNSFHAQMPGYQYVSAQCLSCHPNGTRGRFTQHDNLYFPVYSGTHAGRWSSCATCHTDPATRSVFTCIGSGCHQQSEMNSHHQAIPGYGPDPASCLRCHPTGRKPVAPGIRLEPLPRRPGDIRRP